MKNTTIAQKFARRFERAGHTAKGFKPWDHLTSITNQMFAEAVECFRDPDGNGSYDQSLIFRFADGSFVILHNPDQAAFAAYLSVYAGDEE